MSLLEALPSSARTIGNSMPNSVKHWPVWIALPKHEWPLPPLIAWPGSRFEPTITMLFSDPTDGFSAPPVTPELIRVNYEFRRLEHGDWQDYEYRIATIRRLTEECLDRGEPSPLLPFRALFLPMSQELRLAIAGANPNG